MKEAMAALRFLAGRQVVKAVPKAVPKARATFARAQR